MLSNILFYGLGAIIITLSYFASHSLNTKLSTLESKIEANTQIIKTLQDAK